MKTIVIAIIIIAAGSLVATPFWDAETHREAREKIEALQSRASARPMEMDEWRTHPRFSYPHEVLEMAHFWRTWQLLDPDSAEHGGIIEAESGDLRDVIQTDNTQEVVWDWAFYVAHSGDSSFIEDIDSAWVYLRNFPAYNEELAEITPTFTSYYYRVWNSALGLLLDMGLRDMIGDSSHVGYADSCARVVMFNKLSMDTPWPEIDGLHALVNAFAAGALYQWSLDCTCIEYGDSAMSIAYAVQEWIDRDTAAHMDYVDWAMSSGTIVWGMMNSRFSAMPESLDSWLAAYGPYLPDRAPIPDDYDPLVWDNSWNIWYANGFRALWNATGDSSYYRKYREILDELLVQDTDGDGGIPVSILGPSDEDMTWISAYLVLYAMDWVIDSLPEIDAGGLNPTVYMPKGWATANDTVYVVARAAAFGDGAAGDVDFMISFDRGILLDTTIYFGWGEAFPLDTFAITPGSEGEHVVGVTTYLPDADDWNDTAQVNFYATAVRPVSGEVRDSIASAPVEAWLYFDLLFGGSVTPYDSMRTDALGGYSIDLPCLTYNVRVEPEFPFTGGTFDSITVYDSACNLKNYFLDRADLVLVDDDTGADYAQYYGLSLDSIGATYRTWDRDSLGPVPGPVGGEMRRHTILWFTGDDSTSTLDSLDIEALGYIVANGGYVILSGQGLCEDLAGNPEFDSLVHAVWLGGDGTPIMNGVPGDPISGDFGMLALMGGGSAGNQRHQDRIDPVPPAVGFLTYSTSGDFAAVRYEDSLSGGKLVFLAFGLEGLPYPGLGPTSTNRAQALDAILKWFDPSYEVAETYLPSAPELHAYPNPFNATVRIRVQGVEGSRDRVVEIYDIVGRKVRELSIPVPDNGKNNLSEIIWDGRDNTGGELPDGLYLVRVKRSGASAKLVLLK